MLVVEDARQDPQVNPAFRADRLIPAASSPLLASGSDARRGAASGAAGSDGAAGGPAGASGRWA